MASIENNSKSGPNSKTKSSLFNRSLTIHSSTAASPKSHLQNTSRFYNSLESMKGKVKKLRSFFETPRKPEPSESVRPPLASNNGGGGDFKLKSVKSMGHGYGGYRVRLPGTEDRIVVYLTSLRGVRRTYEDCYAVRMIFRGFRVWVDERDVSMDSEYRKELQGVLGEKNVSLPQVFIRGDYVGGADVVKSMFETGELVRVLDRLPRREPGFVCEACGDVRFVPCGNCSGSRKVFDDDEGQLKRCLECNENGLIRCPDCCS